MIRARKVVSSSSVDTFGGSGIGAESARHLGGDCKCAGGGSESPAGRGAATRTTGFI